MNCFHRSKTLADHWQIIGRVWQVQMCTSKSPPVKSRRRGNKTNRSDDLACLCSIHQLQTHDRFLCLGIVYSQDRLRLLCSRRSKEDRKLFEKIKERLFCGLSIGRAQIQMPIKEGLGMVKSDVSRRKGIQSGNVEGFRMRSWMRHDWWRSLIPIKLKQMTNASDEVTGEIP